MANDLRARLGLKDGGPAKLADGGAVESLRTRLKLSGGGKVPKVAEALREAAKAGRSAAEAAKAKQAGPSAQEREANLAKFLEPSAVQMRLYHGTTATHDIHGKEAIRNIKPSKEGALGSGVYLTPKTQFANEYANPYLPGSTDFASGNVLPVYAQLRNPLVLEGKGDPMIEALTKLGMDEDKAARMVERAYENKGYIGKEVESRARAQGFDGLMQYRDGELSEVVSYNPSAIKSALGNEGTYDTSVPLLNKATGGEVHMQNGGKLPPGIKRATERAKQNKSVAPIPGVRQARQAIQGYLGMDPSFSVMDPEAQALESAYRGGETASVLGDLFASLTPFAAASAAAKANQLPGLSQLIAYHGSPHKFKKFDASKIGTGEGAQAYGHGLYFAENPAVAKDYRKELATEVTIDGKPYFTGGRKVSSTGDRTIDDFLTWHVGDVPKAIEAAKRMGFDEYIPKLEALKDRVKRVQGGALYTVDIPDEKIAQMLDLDKPLSQQPWQMKRISPLLEDSGISADLIPKLTGKDIMAVDGPMASWFGVNRTPKMFAEGLRQEGIPGVKYLDQVSRNKPLKDIKREFLNELPEDASIDEVVELLGTGTFSPKNEAIIKELAANDWLGFDYPAQSLSTVLSPSIRNYEVSPSLMRAINEAQEGGTRNFVLFPGEEQNIKMLDINGEPQMAAGGAVSMQDGGSTDRFMGKTPKRGVSSLPGYGQGNVLQSIESVLPSVAGGLDVLLTGAPVVAKALTSPVVSLGTFAKEAAASGDPRDTSPLERAREASQEYITGNIRLPQTETGTRYLENIADTLEDLPDFKIPPIIPQLMTIPPVSGIGGALRDVAKTASKAKIPDVPAPKAATIPTQGVTYETTTEGPFYRVRPSVSQAPAGQRRGTLESDGTQAGYAVTGRTGSDVPQPITNEAVQQIMADPANFVRRSADTYSQDVLGKPYELPDVPESSIFKQAPIGRTFMLAATDDPAYKKAIFEQYARQMPEVVEQSGAKNYDELVAAAYRQMAKETDEQFKRLPISLSYHRAGEGNYRNSKQMLQDVYGNKHLYVFQGGDEHPYLKAVDPVTGLNENEKFRAVHDFFGHAIHGNEFGPKGEETAWAAHSRMYSPLAQLAMSTETRGQNSTVNYTPLNAMVKRTINELNMQRYEANRRGKTDMVKEIDAQLKQAWNDFQFAPQKPLLLPPEFLNPRYEGSMPDYLRPLIKPEAGTTVSTPLTHYSKQAGLAETDPAFYGTGIKGEEAARLDLPGAIRPRTYFYAGEGITPEPGLGPNRYRAMGENLYDLAADPLMLNLLARETTRIPMTASSNKGLAQPGEATNALERLIRDYGYAGYLSPQSTKPSAVMFGKTPVQPYAKGGKVRFTDDPDVQGMVVQMAKGGSKPAAVAEALKEAAKATKASQKVGPPTPAALQRAEAAERALRKQKGFENMRPSDQEVAVQAARAKALGVGLERSTVGLEAALPGEKDIARSLMSVPAYKKADAVPISAIEEAKQRRAIYRQEPAMTPGPKASEKEWEKWGKSFGVNMTLTKPESVNISDPLSKREIKIPGGLEGTFTIPDMFWMKANNVNPAALPKDVHDQLMLKFIRTHNVSNPDEVDIFNRLNFALLSPNAPLTQNEFLAMRARIRDMDELRELAARKGEKGLAQNLADEMGVSSASKGGLGILGTANLGNQAELARLILQKPEMFQIQPGETMRDVTMRVMNQVPGLGPKTASLGTPWIDLERANTSAVDLHMIRDAWPRLLNDPDVGPAFRERIANLLGVEPTVEAILSQPPNKIQEKAVQVIGGTDVSRMYRTRQGGLSNIPESATPEKLVFEPKKFREFNPFYNKVVEYVDESRGADPLLELFPEQWRKWDVLRKRIEPHEFAHPDYRLLPKSSFNEMQAALEAHKKAGYTGKKPVMGETDWRKLYYGAFAPVGVGLGAAALSEMDTGMATE